MAAAKRLESLKNQVPDFERRFPRWLRDRLAVIPMVYTEQKEMFNNNTHTCPDRIVSLEQPHCASH